MHRIASALVLGGGVLLATWVVAPAAPSQAPPPVSARDLAVFDQAAPALAEVNAQVDRLREHLAAPPQFPAPARNPFRFGERPEPPRPKAEPAAPALVETLVAPPVLPRLVAVMSGDVQGVPVMSAVLAIGDDVQIVKTGDTVAAFTVRSVGADAIELVERASGATFRISLR